MRRTLVLLAAVAPSLGFTNCNYFGTVTVPATDTTQPVFATHRWIGGVEAIDLGWTDEVVTDPADAASILIAPAIYDSGGAQRLSVTEAVEILCRGGGYGQISWEDFFPQTTTQSGGVGSSVSNGMYLFGQVEDLAQYDTWCPSGMSLVEVDYRWEITGSDFAGNQGTAFEGQIAYLP